MFQTDNELGGDPVPCLPLGSGPTGCSCFPRFQTGETWAPELDGGVYIKGAGPLVPLSLVFIVRQRWQSPARDPDRWVAGHAEWGREQRRAADRWCESSMGN